MEAESELDDVRNQKSAGEMDTDRLYYPIENK